MPVRIRKISTTFCARLVHVLSSAILMGVLLLGTLGCQNLAGGDTLPPNTPDPGSFKTPEGALSMYRGAVAQFEYSTIDGTSVSPGAFVRAAIESGLLTDELQGSTLGGPLLAYTSGFAIAMDFAVDARDLPEASLTDPGQVNRQSYELLQLVRARSAQGIGALAKYAPNAPPALRGHLYALAGYAEILLGELYCSGVPLTTYEFEGDFMYRAGSTSQAVFDHAKALFDTAITLSGDSSRIVNLARVGAGRALINMGRYHDAAVMVQPVPLGFAASFPVDWTGGIADGQTLLTRTQYTPNYSVTLAAAVADRKGGNGLPYRSSGDPRTEASAILSIDNAPEVPDTVFLKNMFEVPLYFPTKYGSPAGSTTPMVVASGLEAQLIEAEAALHGDGVTGRTTVDILNQLRETYYPGVFSPIPAGTSGNALVDTLFAERAAWLFLTGHRQGDLRRMIRQYGRTESSIFPSGPYPVLTIFVRYGNDVTFPIPTTEDPNPLFTGCLDRGA